jgi:hypothetical protein
LNHVAQIKSLICQLQLGILLWNRNVERPSPCFRQNAHNTILSGVQQAFSLAQLPPQSRYWNSKRGLNFRIKCTQECEQIKERFTVFIFHLHEIFEELKDADVIQSHEITRLTDVARVLHSEVEKLHLIKLYRTTSTARNFIRIFPLIVPIMDVFNLRFSHTYEQNELTLLNTGGEYIFHGWLEIPIIDHLCRLNLHLY